MILRTPANTDKNRTTQRGVVLFVSLVFLIILSFVALYAMRGTITAEQVAKNMRATQVANSTAEIGLRYCEDQIRGIVSHPGAASSFKIIGEDEQTSGTILRDGDLPNRWDTRSNWWAGALVNPVPREAVSAATANLFPSGAQMPLCMVERFQPLIEDSQDQRKGYLVTAVGFSPEYVQNAAHNPIAGSEAWLQSVYIPNLTP